MTPFYFLLANKVCFCKQTRPTKKPDFLCVGLSFRVIKTISQKNLLSVESGGEFTTVFVGITIPKFPYSTGSTYPDPSLHKRGTTAWTEWSLAANP